MDPMTEVQQPIISVVDDDEAVRDALVQLFLSVDMVVNVYASGREFLENMTVGVPGCLITDIRMPGMSGMEIQQEMNELDRDLPIVMITGHGDVETGIRAMKAGAFDFIQKPFNDQRLLEIVNLAIEKNVADVKRSSELAAVRKNIDVLSAREQQVLDLIVEGMPNKRIADNLELSDKTVEFHRSNIMKKMQAKTLAELIRKSLMVSNNWLILQISHVKMTNYVRGLFNNLNLSIENTLFLIKMHIVPEL